jgi:hypothetical protein
VSDPNLKTMSATRTPSETSEFEREQLRFFLSSSNLAAILTSINPSLSWLSVLWNMELVQDERQLIGWIERNFSDASAVKDVVANINLFSRETAKLLEFRLGAQGVALPRVLLRAWRLVIRHIKNWNTREVQSDWFEIEPQIARGEHSPDLLERLARALRPKLKLSKRFDWNNPAPDPPERITDLMQIEFEVEDGLTPADVLGAWPEQATAEIDTALLSRLTEVLILALQEATDVGVEGDQGYGLTDTDVPSIASHEQNAYRTGFQAIVRVIAELWLRLATKSPHEALAFFEEWQRRGFRLLRRLALFCSATPHVPGCQAGNMLLQIPSEELFFTGSAVEVYRLIRLRWREFGTEQRGAIVQRIIDGPPRRAFKEGADIDKYIDRSRFDILAEMQRDNLAIDERAGAVLEDIRGRWPLWQLRPPEQAGFHVWFGGDNVETDSHPDALSNVPDGDVVRVIRASSQDDMFRARDKWAVLCSSDADRALRALASVAGEEDWDASLWGTFLWGQQPYRDRSTEVTTASLLLSWPKDSFEQVISAASFWLDQHASTLAEDTLWKLWDRIADTVLDGEKGA